MKLFIFLLFSINCYSQHEFITIWNSEVHEPNNSIQIPIYQNDSTYSYSWQLVDDNFTPIEPFSLETIMPISSGVLSINFPVPGLYRIKIETNSTKFHIRHNEGGYSGEELLNIEQWGNINWSSFNQSFLNCIFMDISATDIPNLQSVTDLSRMFSNCSSLVFNNSINNWNVSNVTKFKEMFANAFNFNQPIGDWDMSNAKTLELMFLGANSFDQPIGEWIVSNVTNFFGTFHYNSSFNKPVNKWNVINGDTLSHMFCGTLKFNQNLELWSTQNATKMSWMFNGANKFNQDLSTWKLNSVDDAEKFFDFSAMDCENFSATMTAWSNNPNLTSNIVFGIDNMKYSTELIPIMEWFENTKNWTFQGTPLIYDNCSLSTEEIERISIKIYPNPTNDYFTIEGVDVNEVEIYNRLGQLLLTEKKSNQISINQLDSGIYILRINKKSTHQIIKK